MAGWEQIIVRSENKIGKFRHKRSKNAAIGTFFDNIYVFFNRTFYLNFYKNISERKNLREKMYGYL